MRKKILFLLCVLLVGIVSVLGLFLSSSERTSEDALSKLNGYEADYTSLVVNEGVDAAFKKVKEQYKKDSFVYTQCHQIMHVIGRTASKEFSSVGEAFKEGDAFCWSGYYHGIMEGFLYEVNVSEVPVLINSVCEDIPGKDKYTFSYYNCVHGLGHGVMYITGNELFKSLQLCDNLEGWWEQESCFGGVFMENIIADLDGTYHSTKYLRKDDPLYPCNEVGEKYKQSCYLMQTSYMLKLNRYDFRKGFSLCKKVDENFVETCYQSLGRDASGSSVYNIKKTREKCMEGSDYDQRSNCVIGAVKDFISNYHDNKEAKRFCDSLDQEYKVVCHSTGKEYYYGF